MTLKKTFILILTRVIRTHILMPDTQWMELIKQTTKLSEKRETIMGD